MKKVVVLLMLTLFASSAFAVVDDGVNSMGIYFDMNADQYEFASAPYVVVPTHIVLTNPDFGALYGYEFGYFIEGNHMVSATTLMGTGPIDVGGAPGNHIVGLAAPMATSEATILCTLSIFVLDAEPIAFTLKGATPNSVPGSETPAVLLEGDVIMATGVSAGPNNVCAYINGAGVVSTDEVSMDAVKALYR